MNVTYNPDLAIINDFIRTIIFKYNNLNFTERFNELGLIESQEVTDAFNYLWDGIDNATPGLALFFSKAYGESAFFSSYYDNKNIINYETINDLVNDFLSIHVTDLTVSILEFYDSKNHDKSYYKDILSDTTALFKLMAHINLTDTQKVEFLGLIYSPDSILKPIYHLFQKIEVRLLNVYSENSKSIKTFSDKTNKLLPANANSILDPLATYFKINEYTNSDKKIIITYSFMCEYMTTYMQKNESTLIVLGIKYEEMIDAVGSRIDTKGNELFLKAFSDKHRIEIIRLLMNGEMYVGQIAAACHMVMSTTSYHLDKLLSAGILCNRIVHKRVYYKLDTDFIDSRLNEIIIAFQARVF